MQDISDEVGLSMSEEELKRLACASPHASTPHSSLRVKLPLNRQRSRRAKQRSHPQYVVLDMIQMHNLDASAATSCFLQLAKMCEKRGILLCASGVIPRVEWMLRSHHVAYEFEKEVDLKKSMLFSGGVSLRHDKIILFLTIFEVRIVTFGFILICFSTHICAAYS